MLYQIDEGVRHARTDMIDYICSKCGYIGQIRYDHFVEGIGCSVCSGKKTIAGLNDFCTDVPEAAKFLKNIKDGQQIRKFSHKKLEFRCPDCGFEFIRAASDVTNRGIRCPICTSSTSYPNRFMFALLSMIDEDFVREAHFEWNPDHRYDFYIPRINTIIEMHGSQHYTGFSGGTYDVSLDMIQQNDRNKFIAALKNGISKYIIIDSSESTPEYISSNIMKSALPSLISIDNINWSDVSTEADRGRYQDVLESYRVHGSAVAVSRDLNMDVSIVARILKCAANNRDCDYSVEKMLQDTQRYAALCRKKPVICLTTGVVFESVKDASEKYGIKPKTLSASLNRHKTTSASIGNLGIKLQWDYYNKE